MKSVLVKKAEQIQYCINRIHDDYNSNKVEFEKNETIQDAVILNLQRACESCIDMAAYLVKEHRLGVPESSRDCFILLAKANIIPDDLSENLQKMVGFRNLAIHNYTEINLDVVRSVIEHKLDDLSRFSEIVVSED